MDPVLGGAVVEREEYVETVGDLRDGFWPFVALPGGERFRFEQQVIDDRQHRVGVAGHRPTDGRASAWRHRPAPANPQQSTGYPAAGHQSGQAPTLPTLFLKSAWDS